MNRWAPLRRVIGKCVPDNKEEWKGAVTSFSLIIAVFALGLATTLVITHPTGVPTQAIPPAVTQVVTVPSEVTVVVPVPDKKSLEQVHVTSPATSMPPTRDAARVVTTTPIAPQLSATTPQVIEPVGSTSSTPKTSSSASEPSSSSAGALQSR